VESPAELGERLGAYKGNYYHIDMTLDQMVFFRPLPEIANYQTPIEGLYLTAGRTHLNQKEEAVRMNLVKSTYQIS
jgi:beta-carotene ketolase (CrtO type)